MRQCSLERFSMIGICGGLEIVHDALPGKLQPFTLLLALNLLRSFALRSVLFFGRLAGFHLGFDVLTFPTSCHNDILTQSPEESDFKWRIL